MNKREKLFDSAAQTILSSGMVDVVVLIALGGNPPIPSVYYAGNGDNPDTAARDLVNYFTKTHGPHDFLQLRTAFQEQRLKHDLMLSLLRKVIDGDFKCDSTLLKNAAAIFNEVSDN